MSSEANSSASTGAGAALVSKLRFPEFMGHPIQELLLADASVESTERNGSGQVPSQIMGVSKAEGIVPMEERIVAADTARYKFVRKDWFAYNPMRLNIGSIARWQGENDILVSPDYVVFKCKGAGPHRLDPAYLDHYRRSDAWDEFVSEKGDGSVRVRIYYKDLARLQLALPSFPEQQKIADCLDSADALIAAQGRKVEALKAHKKGLKQQLFPQEGETQPRLRFPEFKGAGEWEERPFEDFVARSFYGTSSSTSQTGRYPVLRMGNMTESGIDFSSLVYIDLNDSTFASLRLEDGDILLNRTNSPALVGKVAIFRSGMECITASYIVTYRLRKSRIDSSFCNAMLNTAMYQARIKKLAKPSVSQANINPTTFKKELIVSTPSVPEQQRIADCLTSLDDVIAAETRKLHTLRVHKKGLMQQLFPFIGEE